MDISTIFKSKTRKELFRFYFTNPDSECYLRELERIINIPVSMIRNELLRLQEAGIFVSYKKGNLVYYKLNKSYPLFVELKSIVFKTIGIGGLLKESLGKINGIEASFIYGSFAHSQEKVTSDIDLFIVGKINEDILLRRIRDIERIIKREINYTLYSKDEFKKKKKHEDSFILDILANKKIFLIGDEDVL